MKITLLRSTSFLLALSTSLSLCAQQTAPLVPSQLTGPPPSQIATAHKVFLTSAGFSPRFPIDSARVYNEVYAMLRAWGHFELVPSAEQADLVLELRGFAPASHYYGPDGQEFTYTTPAFQLNVIDAKAGTAIWTISSPVVLAGSRKTYDHWVTVSESNLVSRLQVLTGQPLNTEQTADLTTVPVHHYKRTAILLGTGIVAVGVGGGLLIHHAYENSLADQKASQDAFCKANNIPLSMCAGG